jgi:hypothetical protein
MTKAGLKNQDLRPTLKSNFLIFKSTRFQSALKSLLAATNPYASSGASEVENEEAIGTDCIHLYILTKGCICIGSIAPYQALFIAPCSHCYHFKVIINVFNITVRFLVIDSIVHVSMSLVSSSC